MNVDLLLPGGTVVGVEYTVPMSLAGCRFVSLSWIATANALTVAQPILGVNQKSGESICTVRAPTLPSEAVPFFRTGSFASRLGSSTGLASTNDQDRTCEPFPDLYLSEGDTIAFDCLGGTTQSVLLRLERQIYPD